MEFSQTVNEVPSQCKNKVSSSLNTFEETKTSDSWY